MGEIYLITNHINGKKYVGQTKYTTEQRWKEHVEESFQNRSNSYLHKAIKKYKPENFTAKRLLINIPEEDLDRLECSLIKRMQTLAPDGYNLTKGGGGVRGYKHSTATKTKLREIMLSKEYAPDHGEKIKAGQRSNNSFEKRGNNPNWRMNISRARLGRFKGEDNPFGGKHHTEKTKQIISEANSKAVYMYSLEGELIKEFKSLVEAKNYLISEGITSNESCQTPISKCCRGKESRKTAYGFIWKYEKV